ncbi:MAG: DUF2279 domain-containing protein [Cytophagales bacterium]|nr:MAG: DUF2279 domain-containing protein [Cytophagales bacterium]
MIQNTTKSIFFGLVVFLLFWFFFYILWYSQQMSGSFHFFDDSKEWLFMDKMGHFYSSFVLSWVFIEFLKLNSIHIRWYSGIFGFYFLLPIEIMDGFSMGYGFSIYDFIVNLIGSVVAYIQFFFFKKIIILPKFSFLQSGLAHIRPELLGYDFITQCFKDYNGQIYWLNISPNFLFKTNIFPKWLLLSVGYSAFGMLGGHDNGSFSENYPNKNRTASFHFSLDIDWNCIKTKSKFTKLFLCFLSFFKIPIYV